MRQSDTHNRSPADVIPPRLNSGAASFKVCICRLIMVHWCDVVQPSFPKLEGCTRWILRGPAPGLAFPLEETGGGQLMTQLNIFCRLNRSTKNTTRASRGAVPWTASKCSVRTIILLRWPMGNKTIQSASQKAAWFSFFS